MFLYGDVIRVFVRTFFEESSWCAQTLFFWGNGGGVWEGIPAGFSFLF
jgi:hypothetical protein